MTAVNKALTNSTLLMDSLSNGFTSTVMVNTDNSTPYLTCIYLNPSSPSQVFESELNFLDNLLSSLSGKKHLLAGDFNAWSKAWGSKKNNKRGSMLQELFASHNYAIMDQGKRPTFRRGNSSSIIDLTLASPTLSNFVTNWFVNEDITTLSDHLPIQFQISKHILHHPNVSNRVFNSKLAIWDGFNREAKALLSRQIHLIHELNNESSLDLFTIKLESELLDLCHKFLPTIKAPNHTKKLNWWNDNLNKLRKKIKNLKRKLNNTPTINHIKRTDLSLAIEEVSANYKNEIQRSACSSWRDFCSSQDSSNPWNIAYKIIKNLDVPKFNTTILKPDQTETTDLNETLHVLADHFFPSDGNPANTPVNTSIYSPHHSPPQPFTPPEVKAAFDSINFSKAPGPDGLDNLIMYKCFLASPDFFLKLYNKCLVLKTFPNNRKLGSVLLLKKPNQKSNSPKQFRPICLLKSIGKLYEKLIHERLYHFLHLNNKISKLQFGFKKQTSCSDALQNIINAIHKNKAEKKYTLNVYIDIQGAFDNADHTQIIKQLHKMDVNTTYTRIIESFLSNRTVNLQIGNIKTTRTPYKGCPQGSVLSPLEIPMGKGCQIQAYADDLLLSISNKKITPLFNAANETLSHIARTLKDLNLKANPSKTQFQLFKANKKTTYPPPWLHLAIIDVGESPELVTLSNSTFDTNLMRSNAIILN